MTNITSIGYPEFKLKKTGLNSVKLTQLGKLVVLAGRNGAGKSRILNTLKSDIDQYNLSVNYFRTALGGRLDGKSNEEILNGAETQLRLHSASNPHMHSMFEGLDNFRATYVTDNAHIKAIQFFPSNAALSDPQDFSVRIQKQYASNARSIDNIEDPSAYALSYIQIAQNKYYDALNREIPSPADSRANAIADYASLTSLIKIFLGVEPGRADGSITLFDRGTNELSLSAGQTILLKLVVRIHAQGQSLNNVILTIDEPENHLHPDAAREMIDRLLAIQGNTQIFIATHSVPLLAHLNTIDNRALWFVSDGVVEPGAKRTLEVLSSLLGDQAQIESLSSFISLPAILASNNFATQCLYPPAVHGGGYADPQTGQIAGILKNRFDAGPLSLVDFGAGKGRLLNGIADHNFFRDNLPEKLNYIAFDVNEADREACEKSIFDQYGESQNRWFSSRTSMLERCGKHFADIVILCNVLHEIESSSWLKVIGPDSDIFQMLKPDGWLLLVEDQLIPVGEKAHKNGFLVLDTLALHQLFSVTNAEKSVLFEKDDARGDGRLTAHLIARNLLSRVTSESLHLAVAEQRKIAVERLAAIRQQPPSYAAGMQSAFWLQAIGNATLILH